MDPISQRRQAPSIVLNLTPQSSNDPVDASTTPQAGDPEDPVSGLLSRSPHPYRRKSIKKPSWDVVDHLDLDESNSSRDKDVYSADGHGPLSAATSASTSSPSWTRRPTPRSSSSSDSGTEADDEGNGLLPGLPAPPSRLRKGLKDGGDGKTEAELTTPAKTPDILHLSAYPPFNTLAQALNHGVDKMESNAQVLRGKVNDAESQRIREKYTRRKRAEVARRVAELALLTSVGIVSCLGDGVFYALGSWKRELSSFLILVAAIFASYPAGIIFTQRSKLRIPSSFDPAPFLYPVFLPCFVALSLLADEPAYLLSNIILGIASIPAPFFNIHFSVGVSHILQWSITMIPLIFSENFFNELNPAKPLPLKIAPSIQVPSETLALLYPLHQTLLPTIDFLAATSLLPSELQLLSTALINLLLYASSPQAQILKALLWIGGFLLLVCCKDVLHWTVALARVPSWRFRGGRQSRLSRKCSDQIQSASPLRRFRHWILAGETDEFSEGNSSGDQNDSISSHRRLSSWVVGPSKTDQSPSAEIEGLKRVQTIQADNSADHLGLGSRRRNTFPATEQPRPAKRPRTTPSGRPKRSVTASTRSYLSLTAAQAQTRKWLYALYTYAVVTVVVAGPVRAYISQHALQGAEPVGWALGYLFGNIPQFRLWVVMSNLEGWIKLPPWRENEPTNTTCALGGMERIRISSFGEANSRLMLFAYYIGVIVVGLAIVLRLSAVVEVDTRRKVFHGMMVAMFLPTTFIDPTVVSLAFGAILALFLLLDLFRASQLPPISKPLTYFLAPYVDGRDHRGPVIVSHIFLLIGCAIPLWLSLAGTPRTSHGDADPWAGWGVAYCDISMVAGVICVGMGDAAASLIGRRYGRHKWFWGGGKSIEGSAAFAAAVTVGVLGAKAWLDFGGWSGGAAARASWSVAAWSSAAVKALLAAAGTSMTETLLTGGNDNVIVPIVLWLLVRGLMGDA